MEHGSAVKAASRAHRYGQNGESRRAEPVAKVTFYPSTPDMAERGVEKSLKEGTIALSLTVTSERTLVFARFD
ncbi:hypothetical protein NDU88_005774 [Pleurodeles waltl]|uniref:Uncharacterized protein n=1 Tax=Pleurodeles waltl TaxID=8319 RepID=A0AAV7RN62_PLEWA|nr:hypothetical protein NDU88_005774 [Pleurodeles waltl]